MSSEAPTEENTETTIHYLKKLPGRTAQGVFVCLHNTNEATVLIITITRRTATRKLQKKSNYFSSSLKFSEEEARWERNLSWNLTILASGFLLAWGQNV